jgi:hypothetical protein
MVHGYQQWQDVLAPGMFTTNDVWLTDTFSCWSCHWVVHRIVQDQLDYRGCVCKLGAKESHRWWQSSLYGTVWAFLVSIGRVTLIKEDSFGAETWLITQNQKPEKGCVIKDLSAACSKGNGNIVISKDDREICLGTINMCFCWIILTMVTLGWVLLWYT